MKKLYTPTSLYLFFGICWLADFSTYLGRLNFTASIAKMQAADGLSKTALGQVASAFFIAYGAGQLVFPLCVVDVSEKVEKDVHYAVTVQDIQDYEAQYGPIPEGAFVALRTV